MEIGNQPKSDEAWRFAVDLYARPGASEAFLALQDLCSVDVTLLIFALYLGRCRNAAPDRHLLDSLDSVVAPWRTGVVVHLREARRALKIIQAAGEPHPNAENLRHVIKAVELDAERHQIRILWDWFARNAGRLPEGVADLSTHVVERLIQTVVERSREVPDTEMEPATVARAVATIAAAFCAMPRETAASKS